ncbi:DUF1673 family protein [Methanosarcina sp. Mfa9]|uniref:DUF1673 family protein n=1 Tax=Methanosarcina sp. Mfa9 TaxID=3439063 RepID=UPI003F8488C4
MNVFAKSIRKLMGWCPNAKTLENNPWTNPDNFETCDRSGGEKDDRSGGEKTGSNLSRMKGLGLLITSVGTLAAALSLALDLKGNVSSLMVGVGTLLFLIGILLYIRS